MTSGTPAHRFRYGATSARLVAPAHRRSLIAQGGIDRYAAISPLPPDYRNDPYLDYGRLLTREGGILINYKDLDTRLRYLLWRVLALAASTGSAGWFSFTRSPVESLWINLVCLIAVAVLDWWIVWQPVEVYRQLEIRPDCLIIEGKDVFWRDFIDTSGLGFRPDDQDNQILCGIYGTRFVEFATLRRFDDLDRQPEVFAAHLQEAMRQLWEVANVK